MKKHPLVYLKSYGFRLWLLQLLILIFNKFNLFSNYRKNLISEKNNLVKQKIIKKYNFLIKEFKKSKTNVNLKKKICWVYWYQGEKQMPPLVQTCFRSLKKELKGVDILLLDKDNIKDYIDIPSYIVAKFDQEYIGQAHFSDIVRSLILAKYGGIWIDATILVSDKINEEELFKIKTIKFHCDEKTSISKGLWCCFFLGDIDNKLYEFLSAFYLNYWKTEKVIIDYFLLDIMILIAYENFDEVRQDLDNDYNNEKIHKLASILNNEYSKFDYQELLKSNKIHKLSYKDFLDEETKKITYWKYIKEKYNEK